MIKEPSKLSAECLFHFTKKKESLTSILLNYFMPFYCIERLSYIDLKDNKGNYLEMAFPLICFCDIPNSLQKIHRSRFGAYGIGLDKSWGIKNRLTPIIYTHKNTILSANLEHLIGLFQKLEKDEFPNYIIPKDDLLGLKNHISYLMMHYKAYEGFAYLKDEKKFDEKISRFYDEREWRYIPLKTDGLKLNLDRHQYKKPNTLAVENERIQESNKLTFQISDIKYLYLKDESEIQPFLSALSSKYSDEDLEVMKKIIYISSNN